MRIYFKCFVVCLITIFLISGCASNSSYIGLSTEPMEETVLSEFIENILLPNNFQVSFDTQIDPSIIMAKSFSAIDYVFNQDTVIKYLMRENIVNTFDYAEGPGYKSEGSGIEEYLNFYTKSVKGGFVYTFSQNGVLGGVKLSSVISDRPGPYDELNFSTSNNKFDYKTLTDLPFMCYQEASSMILSKLIQIGLPDIVISESYSLDLQTILDHYATREVRVGEESETDNTEFTFTWSAEDECYLFLLQQTLDNIPIINFSWEAPSANSSPAGNWMPYTYISVYLSNRGIINLKASGLYEIESVISEQPLINASEAVQVLVDNMSTRIISNPTEVQSIQLCYVSVPDEGHYQIKPAWCFGISETITKDENAPPEVPDQFHEISYIIIDAFTGEVMSA